MPFRFAPTEIPEVVVVEADAFPDDRGLFMETYKRSAFEEGGIAATFVQDNFSHSRKDVFRGLHYQNPPHAQGKLVGALAGDILDVAVDIRKGSPTFGRYVTQVLSHDNHRMLWVPPGFAHGFLALGDDVAVAYKVTSEYAPQADAGIAFDDPEIALDLPIDKPLLSDKDVRLPRLADADNGFVYEERVR